MVILICLLSLVAVALLSIVLQIQKTNGIRKIDQPIPGPTPYPLFGNAFAFALIKTNKDLWKRLVGLVQKYGKLCRVFIGPKMLIVVTDPQYVHTIISGFAANDKDPYVYRFISDVSPGILSISGNDWKDLRKPVNKLFHAKIMAESHEVWVDKTKLLLKLIERNAGGGIFDIFEIAKFTLLDIICGTHAGVDTVNEAEHNKYDIPKKLARFEEITFKRILQPHLAWNFLFYKTKEGKELKELSYSLHTLSGDVLEKRIEILKKNGTYNTGVEPECYTDVVIDYGLKRNLPLLEVGRTISDFIIAGYEASALITSYLILYFAIYPEYQEKAFNEQKEIFRDSDRPPTPEDVQRMAYLHRAFKEGLRLCGVIGFIRKLTKDVELDKYTLPKGASIYVMLQQIHKDPTYWEKPNEFFPDHFLPEKVSQRPKGAYLPFSHGIRSCPGSQYATQSIITVVSMIIRKFRFSSPLTMDAIDYQFGFLPQSTVGYKVEACLR